MVKPKRGPVPGKGYHYVIEHMEEDDEQTKALPEWVKLEYSHMLTLVGPTSKVHFTSLSSSSIPPLQVYFAPHTHAHKSHVHSAPVLDVVDQAKIAPNRVCLLDPRSPKQLCPGDHELFDVFLYGGILGDDPPRDRTAELRKLGFESRHLGPKQMTTDTAVGVTKIVVEDQVPLDDIPFTDFPTIQLDKHESIEMPFRYVTDEKGEPKLPPGMLDHLREDGNKTIDDF